MTTRERMKHLRTCHPTAAQDRALPMKPKAFSFLPENPVPRGRGVSGKSGLRRRLRRRENTVRVKLAKMLEQAVNEWLKANRAEPITITVNPYHFVIARGYIPSWECYARSATGNVSVSFRSYDRMRDCAAHGITLSHNEALSFDVHANEAKR